MPAEEGLERIVGAEVRQILMHSALVSSFEAWLAQRGLEMHCVGKLSADDLTSWVVVRTDDRLRRAQESDAERSINDAAA